MKHLIKVLILLLIVPQIALAAWWNPLSWFGGWSFLHKKDVQIQTLENRIKELEDKETQKNSATSTNSASPQINAAMQKEVAKNIKTSEMPSQNTAITNYNYIPLAFNENLIKSITNGLEYAKYTGSIIDDEIKTMTQMRDYLKTNNIYNDSYFNTVTYALTDSIKMLNKRREFYTFAQNGYEQGLKEAGARRTTLESAVYKSEKEALAATTNETNTFNQLNIVFDRIKKQFEIDVKDYNEGMDVLMSSMASQKLMTQAALDSLKNTYTRPTPTYTPISYPTYSFPKTTYCKAYNTYGYNYTISCEQF